MYLPLGIKSDYSLLKSMIKIPDLISFGIEHNITSLGLLDDNLFGSIEFYDNCIKNNIKPIIGLDCILNDKHIYLYAKDYDGYKSLLKINTVIQERELTISDLKKYFYNIILVIPYESNELYKELNNIFYLTYISYKNDYEKRNALLITNNIIFLNIITCLNEGDTKYYYILDSIRDDNNSIPLELSYPVDIKDTDSLNKFIDEIDIVIDKNNKYIPVYSNDIKDSFEFLCALCKKGLSKRLNGNVTDEYTKRLNYELSVIKSMGFVDYFLIVYDYVKYAKTHDILVGAGRGSAAGSLVSYSIGITNIDPLKYNLLFERFLNPERITMPDIDIDFEDVKREDMINYVREKYGEKKVAPIMTFGTLSSRQVLKDVAKSMDINDIDGLSKRIDSKLSLKDNLKNNDIIKYLNLHSELKDVYNNAIKLEGLKRHISTHAAGVVICKEDLDDVIPICINDNNLLTGLTMNYLEELGLLKMDFLAISNLTIMHNVLNLIDDDINLDKIDLEDNLIYDMFSKGDTDGIFQFESSGMRNFLEKLKPKCFSDLYAALALYRPGPMGNIDTFINRKNGKEKVIYLHPSLEPILKETYGIIVYQEQIMQILVLMGNYSYAEADNIRRAMSKKKEDIIIKEKDIFIKRSIDNGYSEDVANNIYSQILKFANYGFNKAHSVSYAYIGYQMAYLKVHYPIFFIANLLNMVIGSEIKTKEYLSLAKQNNIIILKPCVNLSVKNYKIGTNKLRLPLSVIKNVGSTSESFILDERNNKEFADYYDFVGRVYGKSVNKKTIESLIYAGALDCFNVNHKSMINNLDNAIRYAELRHDLDESLVEKPMILEIDEYESNELMEQEYDSYGFYISNHPSSKYITKDIVKLSKIKEFFNKIIKCVVIINNVHEIKTKKGDRMAFLECSDETGTLEFVLFPKGIQMLNDIKKNDLVQINGVVTRRFDKYQVTINKISKI